MVRSKCANWITYEVSERLKEKGNLKELINYSRVEQGERWVTSSSSLNPHRVPIASQGDFRPLQKPATQALARNWRKILTKLGLFDSQ